MYFSECLRRAVAGRWEERRAWDWYRALPWLVGCNYTPAYAVNQLEMWQAETFDLEAIERELGWLAEAGLNSLRVFLHNLLWAKDASGFLERLERFLECAHRRGFSVMPVFFDSCWHPFPSLGRQRASEPGVHNSGWVQSPGVAVLRSPEKSARLEDYVSAVTSRFGQDERVLAWDVWNEPDNDNQPSYGARDLIKAEKIKRVLPLLASVFEWARKTGPRQPLTSGVWQEAWMKGEATDDTAELQTAASDVISFHRYALLHLTEETVERLKRTNRPLICTEYLARNLGNTFETILPYFKDERIGAYQWGGVMGKTQTHCHWNSWQEPHEKEPEVWQHDLLRPDGTPYRQSEIELLRRLTE